jgi:hypothetical protein
MSELPQITVDFNNQDEDDLVFARLARASRPLEEGDWVLALDGEGNECHGLVARIEDGIVFLDLAWSTWVDDESPRTGASVLDFFELQGQTRGNGSAVAQSESAPSLVRNL